MKIKLRCPKCNSTLSLIKSDFQTEEMFEQDVNRKRYCWNENHEPTVLVVG